jgi:hypothetical protein
MLKIFSPQRRKERKGKQNNLWLKSKEVDGRITTIYRLSAANRIPPLFDTIRLVFSGRAQKPSATFVGENVAWENATVSWVLKSER